MQWTNDQVKAIKLIEIWRHLPYRTDENRFFTLEGAAGTGKSTVVTEILKIFAGFKICVSAPTHTAKEVIGKITNMPAMTIHSLLGLRPDLDLDDFDPINPAYSTQSEEHLSKYELVIIDETSMVNKYLNKKIKDKAVQFGVLILFVGDAYQLPPVNEALSDTFRYPNKAILKEVVRQKDSSPNQQLLLDARLDIENNTNLLGTTFSKPFSDINSYNDTFKEQGIVVTNDSDAFYERLINLYSDSEAITNRNFIKTLAYTNEAVEKLNNYIKARINPSEDLITDGDYLLGYKTVLNGTEVSVQNGSTYYIYRVDIVQTKISQTLLKFFKVIVETTGKFILILHPDSYKDFHSKLEHLYENGINKRAWRPFYRFKEQIVVMHSFYHSSLTDYKTGKPKLMCKKDIDLGYSQTVHKAQGSTYDNVAVIHRNFSKCWEPADRKRLLYVALSRTKYLNLVYI